MSPKELYRKFRTWQKSPIQYKNKNEGVHHCANCGHEFEGNYCPICRQEAGDGRISWIWVQQSIMNLWGMDSRSMPYSLFQLLIRPGYFIRDFISGRRQVSYPPVGMLFGVAVVYVLFLQIMGWGGTPAFEIPDTTTDTASVHGTEPNLFLFKTVFNWLQDNPGWGMMATTMILILPTWVYFHHSPRHPRHTLPEGVFIQIFMAILLLVCTFLSEISFWFSLLIPFYFYLTYRQLFGYRFWGTLWRLVMTSFVWFFIVIIIVLATLFPELESPQEVIWFATAIVSMIAILAFILFIGYRIGKTTEKRRIKHAGNQAQQDTNSPEIAK